jgi:ferredoxin
LSKDVVAVGLGQLARLTPKIGQFNIRPRTQPIVGGALMPYIIAQPCIDVKDRGCVDVCPVDCIYEGTDQLYIHPDECIDCGACEPECPVTAIFPEEDTPDQWKAFIEKNRVYFDGAEREVAKGRGSH